MNTNNLYVRARRFTHQGLLLILLLAGCSTMENYEQMDGPIYTGQYAPTDHPFDGTIKVVTWNIKFGREIEQAIDELSTTPELTGADLLLLQELHADGVDAVAKALGYNYVYYPASRHSRHNQDFGNAVLSIWPLIDSRKVLLPNANWRNGQRRIAVQGTTQIDDLVVDAYSVHTETMWMGAEGRSEQLDAIASEMENDVGPAIVGGDFNTLTPQSLELLNERLSDAGFERASAATTPTFDVGIGLTVDHLFARGFMVLDTGVWSATTASDHYPVWALLEVE